MKKLFNVRNLIIASFLMVAVLLAACGPSEAPPPAVEQPAAEQPAGQHASEQPATPAEPTGRVGVVLTTSGRGDRSYNDQAVAGFYRAIDEFGVDVREIHPPDVPSIETSLNFLAGEGYNPIFAIGFVAQEAVSNVAMDFPNTMFAIVDFDFGVDAPPNIISLTFAENEGSFLAGVLAAGMSQTGTVGYGGGMEAPIIQRFEAGFVAGARAYNPDINVLVNYIGPDPTAFSNPILAREIALSQIRAGADVIYQVAGGSGLGVFDAAYEEGILAVGVDSNQNWNAPGTIMASMLKRVDNAVFQTIEAYVNGTLQGGVTKLFNLENDGVGLTDLRDLTSEETEGISPEGQALIQALKDTIPEELIQQIEDLRRQVIEGAITVPYER